MAFPAESADDPANGHTSGASAAGDGLREWARTRGGLLVAFAGIVLCALGWYGISGEKYEARQLPYLASATIPGAALIVAGSVLVVGTRHRPAQSSDPELRLMVGRLYDLLVEPAPVDEGGDVETPVTDAPWRTAPGGARYHRPDCSLVRGKNGVYPVDSASALAAELRPCRLCDPDESGPAAQSGD